MNVDIDDNLVIYQDGKSKGKAHDVIPNYLSRMTTDNWETSLSYLAAVRLAEKVEELKQRAEEYEQAADERADEATTKAQDEAQAAKEAEKAARQEAEQHKQRADELEQYRPPTNDEIEQEAMKIVSQRERQEKINSRAEEILREKKKGKS